MQNNLIHFSASIIIFNTYSFDAKNCYQKTQIKQQGSKNSIAFIDFFKENNISFYNTFMQREISFFPIIRIFGSTLIGQKCCINIHNFYPFFYIEINRENYFDYKSIDNLRKFAILLENAYIKLKTEQQSQSNNQNFNMNIPMQIIHNIIIEQKKNFYGYYKRMNNYLKIECYDPKCIKELMNLLMEGVIMGKNFQCYEAHISHSIHFFSEYNLYGFGMLKLKKFSFRYSVPDINDIDFINIYTKFEENIIWTKKEKINSIINNNKIDQCEEFVYWDRETMVKNGLLYNTFTKMSKSEIEIDACCEDIEVNKNESVDFDIKDNDDIGNEVDLNNLKHHIKHCSSLIDLWEEEIERRKNDGIERLKLEKISDQNYFCLVESFLIKHKDISEKLLQINFNIPNEISNFTPIHQKEDLYINDNCITELVNNRNNVYMHKNLYQHSYAWFKKHYSMSLYDSVNEIGNNLGKDDDILNKLSCFKPQRSIEEQSFNLSARKAIREIMTTKTIDECLFENENDNDIEENKNDIGNRYSLLANKGKIRLSGYNNKYKDDSVYVYEIYRNLFWFCFKEGVMNIIINKMKIDMFYYSITSNPHLNDLFYSNHKDYNLFYHKLRSINKYRLNSDKSIANHSNSIRMFITQYNKIVKYIPSILSPSINQRRRKIALLKSKIDLDLKQFDHIDNNIQLNIIKHLDLIFICKKYVTYGDIVTKIKENKKALSEIKMFESNFFNKLNQKEYDDINLIKAISDLDISGYKPIVNNKYKYFNEISPITEKKIKPSFTKRASSPQMKNTHKIKLLLNDESKLDFRNIMHLYQKTPNLTILSVEVLTNSPSNFGASPEKDAILSIFISIHHIPTETHCTLLQKEYNYYNLIITSISNKNIVKRMNHSNFILSPEYIAYENDDYNYKEIIEVIFEKDEIAVLRKYTDIILRYDPDIIIGYETERSSIAFIANRANYLGYPLTSLISRTNPNLIDLFTDEYTRQKVLDKTIENKNKKDKEAFNNHHEFKYVEMKFGSVIKITGRIIFNLWRIVSSDLKLNDYSLENVVFNIFNYRLAKFEHNTLLQFYSSVNIKQICFSLYYHMQRCRYNLKLLNELELITKCGQFIKIYGIDIESSITRGTQYRVEGVLSRVTRTKNYLLLSASKNQLRHQNPPQFTPIVIEPPKNIFFNPVVVLDFQSLYPSIMIAYNICYSTCLGILEDINNTDTFPFKKFGVYKYNRNLYTQLEDDFNYYIKEKKIINECDLSKLFFEFISENCLITPNKVCFIKKSIREGIMPIILTELLLTRIMIKKSMKKYPQKSQTYKNLHNRQLGIKLLANVIYGYTSAGFSGRMPCTEIGDSIVSIGKETVKTATTFIESNTKWKAKVIYGDTDSLFVSISNTSPKEAIKIGKEMADLITKMNPEPMKLQFEKVYCPLVFNSKKHYAGYKYEEEFQVEKSEMNLDTKGLENVRRDTCEAVSKIIEKIIKILFLYKDLSKLKEFLYSSFDKIISGNIIFKDFVFSRTVKMGTYKGENLPPSAQVAFELYKKDNRFFPVYGMRFPFVVYNNILGEKTLISSVISPEEFACNKYITINWEYYIEIILRVINRFIGPIGVDVYEWYKHYRKPITASVNYYCGNSKNRRKKKEEDDKNNFLTSSYALIFNIKPKNIDSYFKEESKRKMVIREKGDNSSNIKGKFFNYRDKVDQLIEYEEDNNEGNFGFTKRSKMEKIYEFHKEIYRRRKRRELENICRYCADFQKFNIDIEEVPCMMYACKIFFEKRLLDNV